jgi:hypothetical protein
MTLNMQRGVILSVTNMPSLLSVIMLKVFKLSVIMLSVLMLNVVTSNVVMPNVIYAGVTNKPFLQVVIMLNVTN